MPALDRSVHAVRSFNRFYTRRIGILREGHLGSPYSLTEVRVLYELAHRDRPSAAEIARDVGLDAGYLSRMLARFGRRGLVQRAPSAKDRRQTRLSLTSKGERAFAPLNAAASREIGDMLKGLSAVDRERVVSAMAVVANRLGGPDERKARYTLRTHRPGDIGWVVHRHGVLYAREYGWDERFEALVAEIAAHFIQHFDAARERCWIAEWRGEIVGSVFLVRQSAKVAKLRLLYVEPAARGLGIGKRLVDECLGFARRAGYRRITLWTQDILHAATHIYANAGFRLVREEPHAEFGIPMTAQIWERELSE
jgi:DNA-binding MarR family transcriptional regulator/N-acetylglutamate synthase-like GNAT family acetyltransferase